MAEPQIVFNDGAAYEEMMGKWSRIAGNVFLDWIAPQKGARWVDVGCGNGAFTELVIERCAPASVRGVDPSDGQLAYARSRPGAQKAAFDKGDAMALPYANASADIAVMALVLFFVPEPRKGVAEMARVTAPGGLVAAYAWDFPGGGFPHEPIREELRVMGVTPAQPPSVDAARISEMTALWSGAGLTDVETREIAIERTFANFDTYWAASAPSPSVAATLATMSPADVDDLKERLRLRVAAGSSGPITGKARANAVKGRVPK